MRVLVIGSGGREHALAWSLSRSPQVTHLQVAPGNAGTVWARGSGKGLAVGAPADNVPLAATDIDGLCAYAMQQAIDLTVVGPEVPLAAGIVDRFRTAGLRIFGPDQYAAQLESSKAFCKQFMEQHHIPTSAYTVCTTLADALVAIEQHEPRLVVKADGLAAGKGVFVCSTREESRAAVEQIMGQRVFGEAGSTVVLEDCLIGRELSVLAFCDGRTVVPMPVARDHKRALAGDQGANTGGMGAYAPTDDVSDLLLSEIMTRVLQPAVDGMAAAGHPYVGVLYAGLMLTADGLFTLEFNCRFGDPETQVILPLLQTDLVDICNACLDGTLDQQQLRWSDQTCAAVVLAAGGYPDAYARGLPIAGLNQPETTPNALIFQAGTIQQHGQIVTNGGRVLAVSALGNTRAEALTTAYQQVAQISFAGMQYRTDIGRTETETHE